MRKNLIIGIVIFFCGIALYLSSDYITEKVAIGRGQIYRGQSQVNTINGVVDNLSRVKGLGGVVTGSSQDKIDAGKVKVNYYTKLAEKLRLAGIVIIIGAALFIVFSFVRNRRRK